MVLFKNKSLSAEPLQHDNIYFSKSAAHSISPQAEQCNFESQNNSLRKSNSKFEHLNTSAQNLEFGHWLVEHFHHLWEYTTALT